MNFARLNHLFVPSTKEGRDRLRNGRWSKVVGFVEGTYQQLTHPGMGLLLFWLICGALGLEVRARQVYLLWCGVSGAFLVSILLRRFYDMPGLQLRLKAPARMTLGEVLNIDIEAKNDGPKALTSLWAQGPILPWDGSYQPPAPTHSYLPAGEVATLKVQIRFIERGEHHIDPFVVSRVVPLGLLCGPNLKTPGLRFLVLPKPAKVSQLTLPMNHRHQPGGVALASSTGESTEIGGLRPYRAGDPVRDLHHRAWARLGIPVVREYQQEYFTRVGIIFDTDFSAADEETFEAGISLAAGVLSHLARGETLIDLIVMGESLHQLTMGRSLGFLQQGLDLLACVQPGPKLRPENLLGTLTPHLERLSSLVFISLSWDEKRAHIAQELRRNGVGLLVLQVGDTHEDLGDRRQVSRAAVQASEDLRL